MSTKHKYAMGKIYPEGRCSTAADGERQQSLQQQQQPLCEYSLHLFHYEHPLRKKVYKLVTTKQFDFVIIFFIMANSIAMAMMDYRIGCLGRNPAAEDYGEPDKNRCALNGLVAFLNDYVFGVVFLLELVLKVLAFGFAWEGENTYMSDKWNVLDFVCVVAWVVGQLQIGAMPSLTYFRSFRLLRPLKSLSKFPGLRAIISTFLAAIPRLKDVVVLLLFLLLVCSIACMQFFKGYLHYRCRLTRFPTRVPDTWYQPCVYADHSLHRNCIKGRYFPTQAEFEAYRNVSIMWDFLDRDAWSSYSASQEYVAVTDAFNWTRPTSWACESPKYNENTGFPHGVPVTAEYPGKRWGDGFRGKEDAGKLWSKPKNCLWLVDENDPRPCSLPGNNGLHTCWKNTRQQQGRYLDTSNYEDKSEPRQSTTETTTGFAETTCGSNYDEFGHRRFRFAPKLYKKLRLGRGTIPGKFEDWSRWSPGYFRTMFPEFIAELNFGYTNFDNIGYAMVTLFQAVTMEGWTDIMYLCMDVFSPMASVVLFLGLFGVGSMLVLNLVLGVIADTLGDEEDAQEERDRVEEEEKAAAEKKSLAVVAATDDDGEDEGDGRVVVPASPQRQRPGPLALSITSRQDSLMRFERRRNFLIANGSLRRAALLDIVRSAWFSYLIYFCIGLNTLSLCLDDYPRPNEWSQAMELINVALTFVFIIEMFMKLGALGFTEYTKDQFNCFDGCIVVVSIVDLLLAAGNVSFGGGAVFSALRCFRVFRIFKLAKSWTSLQVLLATIYETTQEIGNFLVLLLLFAFIFALAGQQLFANQFRFDAETGSKVAFTSVSGDHTGRLKTYNLFETRGRGSRRVSSAFKNTEPQVSNFDDFGLAFITVFGILTGESWNLVMYDMIRGTNFTVGAIYMGLTIIILSFCLMNMFLAILLSKFEGNEELSSTGGDKTPGRSPLAFSQSVRRITSFKNVAQAVLVLKSASPAVVPVIEPAPSPADAGPTEKDQADAAVPDRKQRKVVRVVEDQPPQSAPKERVSPSPAWREAPSPPPPPQEEDVALGLFGPDHPVRKFCSRCIEDDRFDKFIVVCICTSSLLLAIRTPLMNDESRMLKALEALDLIFTIIFFVECAMKIIALGFLMNGPKSYIREPWNVLDFVIVCFGAATLMGGNAVRSFKALRVFRVFRPLRMLSRSPGLRLVLNSLIIAIPSAINVMVVCVLYMFIFAIMGVGFFKGQMQWCDIDTYPLPDPSFEELLTKPITLKHALENGAFERVHSATQGRCWMEWDESSINAKNYFNVETKVASTFSVEMEEARRERNVFFLSAKFDRDDVEKPKNGFSQTTLDYFARNGHFLDGVGSEYRGNFERLGNLDDYTPTSKDMCRCLFKEEAAWTDTLYLNFDTVNNAFLLLFEIYSTEGWLDYMFQNVDQNGIEMQPIRDHNQRHPQRTAPRFYSFFYHVAFQVVGGFFVMQLFTGIIMEEYMKLKTQAENEGRSGILMSASQEQWVKTQHFMMNKIRPKRRLKPKIHAFHRIVQGDSKDLFEAGIMACIILNAAVMASDVFGQPRAAALAISIINMAFAGVFTIEAVLKIGGVGWNAYWVDTSNRLDFVIVVGTWCGIVLTEAKVVSVGGVASVVRLFRVARIFRIFSSAKNMRKQIAALVSALPGLLNVAIVLMIIFMIWSILLVDIFAHIEYSSTVHPNANFQHVPIAVLTLIRFTTGENWNGFMHELGSDHKTPGCYDVEKFETIRRKMYSGSQKEEYWQDKWCTRLDGGDRPVCPCASFETSDGHLTDVCQEFSTYEDCCVPLAGCGDRWWAAIIVRIFDLLVTGVVLNLFVANILDAYQQEDDEDDIGLSGTDLDNFVEDWARFDENATWHIKLSQLKDFIQILDEPMGFGEEYVASSQELEHEILKLGLRIRKQNKNMEQLGETKLHIMDVAMALGKRIVAKQQYQQRQLTNADDSSAGDEALEWSPEIGPETEVCEDATPILEKFFDEEDDSSFDALNSYADSPTLRRLSNAFDLPDKVAPSTTTPSSLESKGGQVTADQYRDDGGSSGDEKTRSTADLVSVAGDDEDAGCST